MLLTFLFIVPNVSDTFLQTALLEVHCNCRSTDLVFGMVWTQKSICFSCSQVVCVACEDRTVTALSSDTGARLLSPLLLPWPAAHLLCKGTRLLVLTAGGSVHVW